MKRHEKKTFTCKSVLLALDKKKLNMPSQDSEYDFSSSWKVTFFCKEIKNKGIISAVQDVRWEWWWWPEWRAFSYVCDDE